MTIDGDMFAPDETTQSWSEEDKKDIIPYPQRRKAMQKEIARLEKIIASRDTWLSDATNKMRATYNIIEYSTSEYRQMLGKLKNEFNLKYKIK